MKKTVIIMLLLMTLVIVGFIMGIAILGIVEALATGPINETYPAVIFFALTAMPGCLAIRYCKNELFKEMEMKSKEV